MKKQKIAISLDKTTLDLVDSKVDGSIIRSRSQAIEYFLKRGLKEQSVSKGVILLKGNHQQYALKQVKGKALITQQIELLSKNGIKVVYVLTQHTSSINDLLSELTDAPIEVKIIERDVKNNTEALLALREEIGDSNFLVLSGDTYNAFDVKSMIKKHLQNDKLATMGLMTRDTPSEYGAALLEGDLIIDFKEKPKEAKTHVVNAGVYAFKPEIFELFDDLPLEKGLFPKIARIKQLVGYFTYGDYIHMEDV